MTSPVANKSEHPESTRPRTARSGALTQDWHDQVHRPPRVSNQRREMCLYQIDPRLFLNGLGQRMSLLDVRVARRKVS